MAVSPRHRVCFSETSPTSNFPPTNSFACLTLPYRAYWGAVCVQQQVWVSPIYPQVCVGSTATQQEMCDLFRVGAPRRSCTPSGPPCLTSTSTFVQFLRPRRHITMLRCPATLVGRPVRWGQLQRINEGKPQVHSALDRTSSHNVDADVNALRSRHVTTSGSPPAQRWGRGHEAHRSRVEGGGVKNCVLPNGNPHTSP